MEYEFPTWHRQQPVLYRDSGANVKVSLRLNLSAISHLRVTKGALQHPHKTDGPVDELGRHRHRPRQTETVQRSMRENVATDARLRYLNDTRG